MLILLLINCFNTFDIHSSSFVFWVVLLHILTLVVLVLIMVIFLAAFLVVSSGVTLIVVVSGGILKYAGNLDVAQFFDEGVELANFVKLEEQ